MAIAPGLALTSIKPARAAATIMSCMLVSAAAASDSARALPEPRRDSAYPLERALAERRSVREFRDSPLRLAELSQLVWAAQGQVTRSGHRTAPSAGALYPLELFVVAGNVQDLAAGVYLYQPSPHRLALVAEGDRRKQLVGAALGQHWIGEAPAILVIAAIERRTTGKYGARGVRYVHLEAGHAAQNALLQAVALGLGATVVGAFSDAEVKTAAALGDDEQPLYLIPVGRPR
jgi:SagB-type dehydrogenase family enzyme